MVVQHNLTAMNSNRMLNLTTGKQKKSTEKLSSGFRINRAADDAAGLAISEKMRKQIRGLTQASANAQDGISMVQTADGALVEVHDMLQRCNELAVKAANGTISDDDRKYIADEIKQIHTEIDRVRTTSKFNETYLFPLDGESGEYVSDRSPVNVNISYNVANGNFDVTFDAPDIGMVTKPDGTTAYTTILAERIANEFVPNAVSQILKAFPSLDTGETINIELKIDTKDGPGKVLAEAGFTYNGIKGDNFTLLVDKEDFTDDDALGKGVSSGTLESTIAHELTHTIMQNVFPTHMIGSGDFPSWFKEGAAQLSGGGFPTNWNYWLAQETKVLASEDDTSVDAKIATYLTSNTGTYAGAGEVFTVSGRPYGTGYLATMYIGYLANGGGVVDSGNIAQGIDKLFTSIKSGKTFEDAVQEVTGKTVAEIVNDIESADADAVAFIRKVGYNTGTNGAGSIITSSLSVGGTNILGNTASQQKYKISGIYSAVSETSDAYKEAKGSLTLHVGADSTKDNKIEVKLFNVGTVGLGISGVDFSTMDGATAAIDTYSDAIRRVSSIRSYFGSIQNRLEHTIANLDNVVENTSAAESAIRDTDMATEMVSYSNNNILAQAGQAMLAQANQSNQGVLSLLG